MDVSNQSFKTAAGLRFGPWCYWPDSGRLKSKNQELRLSTQINHVLRMMIAAAPAVVTRQQFLESVWNGKIVNEDALSRTIAELRKLLGDSASQAIYIKTIPKQGYQFTHQVEPLKQRQKRKAYQLITLVSVVTLLIVAWSVNQVSVVQRLQDGIAQASRVTSEPGLEQQSILSDDGEWLTYIQITDQGSTVMIESTVAANQLKTVELPRHHLASPVYLSQQEKAIFLAQDQTHCYLKIYDFNSQKFNELRGCVSDTESRTMEWHETTQQVYLSRSGVDQRVSIHQLDWLTQTTKQLTHPPTVDEKDWSPRISPNQQWLSFTRGNQSVRNLWLKNLSTGDEHAITTGEHYSVSHDWYDDNHIVFDSDLNGSRQLWLLKLNDRSIHRLGGYGAQHPSFDKNNHTMTFQVVSYEANIWLYELVTEDFKRLIHSTKYDNYPAFSPDGRQFVFSSNRQDLSSIWLYDVESATEQLLLSIPGVKLTRPSWLADGQGLLVTTNDEQGYGSLRFDLTNKTWQPMDFGEDHLATRAFGDSYFALSQSLANETQILHKLAGQVTVLPIQGISRFELLSNGDLVYSKTNADGLFLFDVARAESSLVIEGFPRNSLNLWSVINQVIYYDQSGTGSGIWRHDVATGQRQRVTQHRPYSVGTSLSISPDEKLLLITRTDRAESDVLKTLLD